MSFVTREVTVDGAQYIAIYSDSNHDNRCLFVPGFDTVYQICLVVYTAVFLLVLFFFVHSVQVSECFRLFQQSAHNRFLPLGNIVPHRHWLIIHSFNSVSLPGILPG